MESIIRSISLEREIRDLKEKLNNALNVNKVNSEKILLISRQLDSLIVGHYNLQKKASV